jgi:exopolyphosphatase / guanosine-5'-triphosphate,3'-diphosphate pyrophosphatase
LTASTAAVIDVGSNSICLMVARQTDAGIVVLHRLKDSARLAAEIGPDGALSPTGEARLGAALRRFTEVALNFGCVPVAVATAALRGASNRADVLERLPFAVRILSGSEEAAVTYAGARDGLGLDHRRTLVVDVGGGSTELCLGRGATPDEVSSLPIGALTLHRSAFGDPPWHREKVELARSQIRHAFAGTVDVFRPSGHLAIACSGTLKRVARLVPGARIDEDAGWVLSSAVLSDLVERLAAAPTLADRQRLPGMDPERADIALAGALIYSEMGKMLGVDAWTVSRSGLRRGLLLRAFAQA